MQDFDTFWNYADPIATELKFREILNDSGTIDPDYRAELQTQIARALGLQRKFTEGHEQLKEIDAAILAHNARVSTRYYLEKGRLFNSNKERSEAVDAFMRAEEIAAKNQFDFYRVDALHMLGIAAEPSEALRWNEKAIEIAELASEERAKNWLGALYNNIGWTYFDMKTYDKAIDVFEKCMYWNIDKNRIEAIRIAKYSIAKCYRMQGKNEEALNILHEIMAGEEDGYIYEELAENYLIQDDHDSSREYFGKAYELLSTDIWLSANEKQRIDRWYRLSTE